MAYSKNSTLGNPPKVNSRVSFPPANGTSFQLLTTHGLTPMRGQHTTIRIPTTLHSSNGQALQIVPSGTSAMASSTPPSSEVNNGRYHPCKLQQKETQAEGAKTSNVVQVDSLMSLLLIKDNQINNITREKMSLKASLQNLAQKEKKRCEEVKVLSTEMRKKEKLVKKFADELEITKTAKNKLVVEKDQLQKNLSDKTTKISEQTKKIESLEEEMESLRRSNNEIWDERRELMLKLEDMERTSKVSREKHLSVAENLQQLKVVVKNSEAEKKKLQKSKEEAFQTVQVLKSVIQQKENRIDQLQGRVKEMARENTQADIAICDCPGRKERLATERRLKEKEESEARLGDMLAKMKSQMSCLDMEKEKARQQMIQAWESETNLRSELEKEKAVRIDLEKTLGKFKKSEKANAKIAQAEAAGNAEKVIQLEMYQAKNAKLTKKIEELEEQLQSSTQDQCEPQGEEREERCRKLYRELMHFQVSPTNCKNVTKTVLKHLLDKSMKLPGKDFAWSAQRKNPPTPRVSDEEEGDDATEEEGEAEVKVKEEIADTTPHRDGAKSNETRKMELTQELEKYGGLWCTSSEMEEQLGHMEYNDWEKAVIIQLQYRSVVLELARESKLLYSSLTGKRKPFPELKESLLKLIKQSESEFVGYNRLKRRAQRESERATISEEHKHMLSPGPDHPILRPRKKQSTRRTQRKVPFDCLHGKVVDHFVYDSDGYRDWHKGVVLEVTRSHITVMYEFAKDCPIKLSIKEARDDFDKGDLVACEVTSEDFEGKVIENLWEMDGGVTEWWRGHVLKKGEENGEDTEYEVIYSESKEDVFIYYVPLFKDYWNNEVRVLTM